MRLGEDRFSNLGGGTPGPTIHWVCQTAGWGQKDRSTCANRPQTATGNDLTAVFRRPRFLTDADSVFMIRVEFLPTLRSL